MRILRDLSHIPVEPFSSEPRNHGSAGRFLQLTIETVLAVGHHIVAARGFAQPQTYAEVLTVLGREAVLDQEFAQSLEPMARMRNRLVPGRRPGARARAAAGTTRRLHRFACEITTYLDELEQESEPDR